MSAADLAQLAAGGYVPAGAKLGKGDAVDVVTARAYRHGVLPGRTVIRLVAQGVAAGDDLEMATLGFGPGESRGAVAQERKRALGFPGWALVHDPKNARYALDVVKELKKVSRRAKSKPGNAREAFDKLAVTLGKTVPHFLPSFYEEVGRVFLDAGAPAFAATYFGKAREAEAVHALEVDEQHRVDAFLEFALAGAVTTKALSQYAKELAEHHAPAVAYAHFRQLCVQRTLGGMPPWGGMAKDLQRLAKAAKLEVAVEDRALVAELVASPALARAAGEFWRAYREPIIELARAQPAVRGILVNLFPAGSSYSAELDDAWLAILDASGAIDALVGHAHADARPANGRAAWFDKLAQHLARDWRDGAIRAPAFALLRRMAPALIADGTPIRCLGRYNRIDLDLCELALELGVPVGMTTGEKRAWLAPRLDLDAWAKSIDQPDRGRDPVRTATHAVLGPELVRAVGEAIGKEPFDTASAGKTGFLAAKRAWLEALLAGAERAALPGLASALEQIDQKVKPTLFADLPELHARLAALDIAPALARSLVIGAIDELGWPALEAVMAELSPDGKTQVMLAGGPPALVCCTKTKLVAVGPTGRLGEHDLVIPAKHELLSARFIGGQFLVVLKEGSTAKGYWSSAPHDVFVDPAASAYAITGVIQRAAVLPDGGWLESARVIRPGDRVLPGSQDLRAYDGATAWIDDAADGGHRWRELTPSGEKGRASWPAVIEQAAREGWEIDPDASYVLPANGLAASPLGLRDGLVGVVSLRKLAPGTNTIVARTVSVLGGATWSADKAAHASTLLPLPGASEPRVVSEYHAWREGIQTTIWDPALEVRGSVIGWKERRYSRAQAAPLSPVFWHAYTLRDAAGSRRLRAVTAADARALMAAIPVENGVIPDATPDEPIAKALPEITSQQLRNGVTGFAIVAVQAQQERDRLARERAPGVAASRPAGPAISDATINAAIASWVERSYNKNGQTWAQIGEVGAWFASQDRSNRFLHTLPATELDWFQLAPLRSVLAFAALAIGTAPEHRKIVAMLFGHLARSLPPGDKLRWFALEGAHGFPGGPHPIAVRWHDGNAYAVRKRSFSELHRVLEYAPDGVFRPPPSGRVYEEIRGAAPGLPAEIASELEAAIATGATSWSPSAVEHLAQATGLSASAAAYLWAGLPSLHDSSANFLAKELRESLGLKAAQAALGRDVIAGVRDLKRLVAIDEAARAGVAALLDGSAARVLANAWVREVGKRVAVPEALIATADRELEVNGAPPHWLSMIADPAAPPLAVDGVFAFAKTGEVIRVASPEPLVGQSALTDPPLAFESYTLHAMLQYLPFLYAELPVGDPLRAAAAEAHERLLARLASPTLWLHAGQTYFTEADGAAFDQVLDTLGGAPLAGLADEVRGRRFPGACVIRTRGQLQIKLHPATLDAKATPLVAKLVTASTSMWGTGAFHDLQYARSPGLAQMMARIRDTPVAAGGWEQNPAASAPKLVERAAKRLGVTRDAAALYLQYLVLLWPTNKQLLAWNAWKPKQLADAQAVLVGKELLVEAKRERAQRTLFLPGGWEALKAPHPPMETWKHAFYGKRGTDHAAYPALLPRYLALASFHAMFAAAWERIEHGDIPRYDEVNR